MTIRRATSVFLITSASIAGLLTGCASPPPADPVAATQPATAVDPATTQPAYWLQQQGVTVTHGDFEQLWAAAEDVARDYLFKIDRVDYRRGELTTVPMVSKQFFEPWRKDVGDGRVVESSLATVRRTLLFQFHRNDDDDTNTAGGTFTVEPKVLVERQSIPERRITSVVQYRSAFSGPSSVGSVERDAGIVVPTSPYWYPIGRDPEMERDVAKAIEKRLRQ